MFMKNRPLEVNIEDDELVIRIGIDTLAFSAEHCPSFFEYDKHASTGPPYCKIVDNMELAKDIRRELQREEENGTTPLHILLDECLVSARDDGSLAFEDEV